jgi:hypothetical protein
LQHRQNAGMQTKCSHTACSFGWCWFILTEKYYSPVVHRPIKQAVDRSRSNASRTPGIRWEYHRTILLHPWRTKISHTAWDQPAGISHGAVLSSITWALSRDKILRRFSTRYITFDWRRQHRNPAGQGALFQAWQWAMAWS